MNVFLARTSNDSSRPCPYEKYSTQSLCRPLFTKGHRTGQDRSVPCLGNLGWLDMHISWKPLTHGAQEGDLTVVPTIQMRTLRH